MAVTFRIEDRANGTKWIQVNKHQMYNISNWCKEHGCGKQVNISTISFKNEEELTMFLLKWQGQIE